jgi:hypothetical protein
MLYQLSYASGPLSSRKEEQWQDRQPAVGCQDAAGDMQGTDDRTGIGRPRGACAARWTSRYTLRSTTGARLRPLGVVRALGEPREKPATCEKAASQREPKSTSLAASSRENKG